LRIAIGLDGIDHRRKLRELARQLDVGLGRQCRGEIVCQRGVTGNKCVQFLVGSIDSYHQGRPRAGIHVLP